MGENRNPYKTVVCKREGKSPLRISRHKWLDNIKININGRVCEFEDSIHLPHERVHWWAGVEAAMNLGFP
jgi:hypothetical protein